MYRSDREPRREGSDLCCALPTPDRMVEQDVVADVQLVGITDPALLDVGNDRRGNIVVPGPVRLEYLLRHTLNGRQVHHAAAETSSGDRSA